ncbi:MAG TPA: enoyl-CoA hydratase-related protein, partial [Actinomycetes bacterium]
MITDSTGGNAPAEMAYSGEVVTRAVVRYLDLPFGAGRFALITLDNGHDHRKPSTFGPGGLRSLDDAITEAAAAGVVGIGVTGKPFIFAVGADLTGVPLVRTREDARAIANGGHEVFRRLGEESVDGSIGVAAPDGSVIPTFAFINGAALGGGLEVALHCTYRTISTGVTALGLPECFLGLVPGWGGAYLLPNLIGADASVKVIIENPLNQNKMLRGPQAFKLGIADAMFEPADFLEQSLRWAADVLTDALSVSRAEPDRGDAWMAAVARGRAFVDAKVHGAAPAPYKALELIDAARENGRDAAFAAEDEALADLLVGPELRSSLYAFDLVQKRARQPVGAPPSELARPVTKVGIVGAGLMASQLALLFVRRLEVPVVITDIDQA